MSTSSHVDAGLAESVDQTVLRRVAVPLVRVPWHGAHSGYDRIIDGLPVRRVTPEARGFSRLAATLLRRAFRSELSFHPSEMIAAELEATMHLLRGAADLVHYLYGEEHAWYAPPLVGRRTLPFIISYHQPPAYLERLLPAPTWRRLLRSACFVTVVSSSQAEFFSRFLDRDRIRVVAHGVDTAYFSPLAARPETPVRTCLTVGRWLRDFELLRSVQRILRRRLGPRIRFVVITSEQEAAGPWPDGVTALFGLADELMPHHYRSADVLCLPLTDGTANNVVLEAMACALPVVVTATDGLRDYVDASCARLVPPGHAEAMADAVADVLEGGGAGLGRVARDRALRFDWSIVRRGLVDLYREALDHRPR